MRAASSVPSQSSRLDASSHPGLASCACASSAANLTPTLRVVCGSRPTVRLGAHRPLDGASAALAPPALRQPRWGGVRLRVSPGACRDCPLSFGSGSQHPRVPAAFQRRQRCMPTRASSCRSSRSPSRHAVACTAAASSASARSASLVSAGSGRPSSVSNRVVAEVSASRVYQAGSGRFVMALVATCRLAAAGRPIPPPFPPGRGRVALCRQRCSAFNGHAPLTASVVRHAATSRPSPPGRPGGRP